MSKFASVLCLLLILTGPAAALELTSDPPAKALTSKHLSLPVSQFLAGDSIRVGWFDTPGNPQDWFSIAAAGAPDSEYGSSWTFTGGKTEGTHELAGVQAGEWELRLYLNWPEGDYKVVDRLRFRVKPACPAELGQGKASDWLLVRAGSLLEGEAVRICWRGLKGDPGDWLAVVPKGAPLDENGKWIFLGESPAGVFRVDGLAAGEYEARLFFDWPKGGHQVRDRLHFQVHAKSP